MASEVIPLVEHMLLLGVVDFNAILFPDIISGLEQLDGLVTCVGEVRFRLNRNGVNLITSSYLFSLDDDQVLVVETRCLLLRHNGSNILFDISLGNHHLKNVC